PSTPSMIRACAVAALLGLVWASPGDAADPLLPLRTATPPVIDGDLGDAVWRSAPAVTGFKTWMPDYGKDMPDQTIVSYAYDAENLYFAFRAFDSEPARIKASIAARDGITADDWVCINLDSFGDRQSLYALYVNPLGIQGDSRYAAGREDFGFDAVWYSAGRIDSQGYTIEVRIPFKSLRYGNANPVRMALIFERRVSRRSEHGTYPPLDPKVGPNFLTQNVPIEFAGIRHYRLVEILPDAVYDYQMQRVGESLERASSGPDVGLTAKYGVTAQLVFDGAVNPDFSQVEADAGQVDVNRRYALFYPEKRPFFLEGRDSFNYTGADYSPMQSVVHTRTIVNPIAGAKLTGKLAAADTLASIYAVDEQPDAAVEAGSPEYAQVAVLRYKRSLEGDSYLGGFYTGREEGDAFNRVYGGDGSLRVTPAGAFGFYAFGSSTRPRGGDTAAGHSVLANYTHDNRKMGLYFQALDISQGFDTWTGYVYRTGVFQTSALLTPRFYPKSAVVRRVEPTVVADFVRDAPSGLWEQWYEGGLTLILPRSGRITAKYHSSNEIFENESFDTTGVQALASAQFTKELRIQGQFAYQQAIYYSADPFPGTSTSASVVLLYQPSDQWLFDLRGTYSGFSQASDGRRLYDYGIYRAKATYQWNRYLFFRGIGEYNTYKRQLLTDFLASFTYIPGTVLHLGYGSLYEKVQWRDDRYVPGRDLRETQRGFFLKASYLWRM
ncbi:MAG: DUF5916 domain-containing protein, partial [Rhodospirillaceae bacterium]